MSNVDTNSTSDESGFDPSILGIQDSSDNTSKPSDNVSTENAEQTSDNGFDASLNDLFADESKESSETEKVEEEQKESKTEIEESVDTEKTAETPVAAAPVVKDEKIKLAGGANASNSTSTIYQPTKEDEDIVSGMEDEVISKTTVNNFENSEKEIKISLSNAKDESKSKEEEKRKKLEDRRRRVIQRIASGSNLYDGETAYSPIMSADNVNAKTLKDYKIDSKDIKTISNDQVNLKDLYIAQVVDGTDAKHAMITSGNRTVRFPLLISGYYAEISEVTPQDLIGARRNIHDTSKTFLQRFEYELRTIFSHITWTSLDTAGKRLTYTEFLRNTKLADLSMLYFAVFDATYPGEEEYTINCGAESCRKSSTHKIANKKLCYLLQNATDSELLTPEFVHDVLVGKVSPDKLHETKLYKKAHEVYTKTIDDFKMKLMFRAPSLFDTLENLQQIQSIFSQRFPNDVDAIITFDPTTQEEYDDYKLLSTLNCICGIVVPVNESTNDDDIVLNFLTIDPDDGYDPNDEDASQERIEINKKIIYTTIRKIKASSIGKLFYKDGTTEFDPEINERIGLRGYRQIIHNLKCPYCKSTFTDIAIDMRSRFFMRTEELQLLL